MKQGSFKWSKAHDDILFMNIAFEISGLSNQPTGVARYITRLISAMHDICSPDDKVILFQKFSRMLKMENYPQLSELENEKYLTGFFIRAFNRIGLFHGLDGYIPNTIGVSKLVSIHDLAAIKLKGHGISSERFSNKKHAVYKKVFRYVDAILTPSDSTKNDVVEFFSINPSNVYRVYHGVDDRFRPLLENEEITVRKKYNLNSDYLLFVGSLSRRKNTKRLVESFSKTRAKRNVELVLAGSVSYRGEETLAAIREFNVENKVKIINFVDDADLPLLYGAAKGLVFPTLYEGFGFPIVEAMACGIPVLSSRIGSASEIAGEKARYVDPFDVESIADGIDLLVEKPVGTKEQLIAHARQFSWRNCAENTKNIYRRFISDV